MKDNAPVAVPGFLLWAKKLMLQALLFSLVNSIE